VGIETPPHANGTSDAFAFAPVLHAPAAESFPIAAASTDEMDEGVPTSPCATPVVASTASPPATETTVVHDIARIGARDEPLTMLQQLQQRAFLLAAEEACSLAARCSRAAQPIPRGGDLGGVQVHDLGDVRADALGRRCQLRTSDLEARLANAVAIAEPTCPGEELADASDDELSFAERCDDVQPALGDDEQRVRPLSGMDELVAVYCAAQIDQTTAAEATHCAPQSQERDIQPMERRAPFASSPTPSRPPLQGEAARLYIPAADQGDANAQGNSGAFCEYGEGDVLQDFGGAERIWKVTLKLAPASPFSGAAEPEVHAASQSPASGPAVGARVRPAPASVKRAQSTSSRHAEHSVTETRSAAAAEQLAVERKQLGTAAGTRSRRPTHA